MKTNKISLPNSNAFPKTLSDEIKYNSNKVEFSSIRTDKVREFIENINNLIIYIRLTKQETNAIKDGINLLAGDKLIKSEAEK